jgi:hypothetical protein
MIQLSCERNCILRGESAYDLASEEVPVASTATGVASVGENRCYFGGKKPQDRTLEARLVRSVSNVR